jgi:hypothetical protein
MRFRAFADTDDRPAVLPRHEYFFLVLVLFALLICAISQTLAAPPSGPADREPEQPQSRRISVSLILIAIGFFAGES